MKTKTTFGISFPNPDLLDQAKTKASAYGLSLSAYVNQLLRRDLGHPSVMDMHQTATLEEPPAAPYAAQALAAARPRRARQTQQQA